MWINGTLEEEYFEMSLNKILTFKKVYKKLSFGSNKSLIYTLRVNFKYYTSYQQSSFKLSLKKRKLN